MVQADQGRRIGMDEALRPALDLLAGRVGEVYVHLDLDVLDPMYASGVNFPTPEGLSLGDVEASLGLIRDRFRIRAASLTAYDPTRDEEDRTLHTALRLIQVLATAAA